MKRTTLAQQLVRGKVAETSVVSISRALGISPTAALSFFDQYSELKDLTQPPTAAELVSQIATMDLLEAVVARSSGSSRRLMLTQPPHATSVRNWVDAVDDGELRHRVSAASGVAPQNYSAQLTANRLSPELSIATSRAAGVGFSAGFVATGLITEAEAGWTPTARQEALDAMTDGELVSLAGDRLQALGRTLRRQEQEQAQTEKIWENLG